LQRGLTQLLDFAIPSDVCHVDRVGSSNAWSRFAAATPPRLAAVAGIGKVLPSSIG
jgi:hypothetical protein